MNRDAVNPVWAAAGVLLGGAAAALAVRAFLVEPASVELTRHEVPVPDLPPAWEGARVVHVTDLHYGDPRSDRLFRSMVDTVNDLEPDLIVLTGDYILEAGHEIDPAARHLARLRGRHGVFGILGDHDFCGRCRAPVPGLVEKLGRAGIRVLRNESQVLPGGLRLAGVEPCTRRVWRGDLDRTLSSLEGRPPHLLLTHSPDVLLDLGAREVPLILCGHTHGGQVVVPGLGPPVTHTRTGRPHASGWSRQNGTRIYTGRGLASHYSVRFLCRPEIALFTLVAA